MANVARHSTTHRFGFVGGTDPLNVELPGLYATEETSTLITADGEFEWVNPTTNNDQCYRWDSNDPAGLLIQTDGFYAAFVTADVSTLDAGVDRGILLKRGTVSVPATDDFGVQQFYAGKIVVDSGSALPTSQEPTTHMWFLGVNSWFGIDPEDPARVSLFFNHTGTNFESTHTRVFIWRLATLDGFAAPMKYEPT